MGYYYIDYFDDKSTNYHCDYCFKDGKDVPITNTDYLKKINIETILDAAFLFSNAINIWHYPKDRHIHISSSRTAHLYDDNYPFKSPSFNNDIYCKECNTHLGYYVSKGSIEYDKKYVIMRKRII